MLSLLSFNLAHATSTGWLTNPQHPPLQVQLALTGQSDAASQTVTGVLQVKLRDDWKTYWQTPGEGGIAPSANWQASSNIDEVKWLWPAPQRFKTLGLETLGYLEAVSFPLQIKVSQFNAPSQLTGTLTLPSCTTVCVLTDYQLQLDFNPSELSIDSDAMYAYNKAMALVPVQDPKLAKLDQLIWQQERQQLAFDIQLPSQAISLSSSTQVFVVGDGDTYFKVEPLQLNQNQLGQNQLGQNQLRGLINVSGWLGEVNLDQQAISLVILDEASMPAVALEVAGVAQAGQFSAADYQGGAFNTPFSWLSMLLLALAGGLILNVMPCVLPVLGIKLSSIVTAKAQTKQQTRLQFIASAAGIISSFWLLAGAVWLLKLSGQSIGWGIQFQQPWFIGFMVVVTGLFALNMLGLFSIHLPSSLQTKLATTGGQPTGGQHYGGHYLQGMFATLLATPCSAPFLGTAVAFALAADTPSLFIIFTALGIGMALPWLLIAALPQLARYLPRPGRWMNHIKLLFAFMLLATTVWLLSLLASFIGPWLWVIYGALAIAICVLVKRKFGAKIALIGISLSFLGLGLVGILAAVTSEHWATPLNPDLAWHMLEQQDIAQQVAKGNTVFVDVTADWCITCKANKVGVLLQQPVYGALQQPNMYLMKGDWTKPAPHISDFLAQYGRYGIPFNIVFGPNAPQGIPLPVILSSDDVLDAINRAGAPLTQ
ncbi:protein-disulfide reductase DsbD family protein [Motilimonas eburnea]|uniref:protein-disulfide reductase DsbD family protein n=1 Tax=Motilimonas eburnea TaxID=1737488 RepID=UPI001E4B2346|nr:protein-disulfide reductase DsbD domain-containing protein [Motilimonas eburnea]MCE2571091.1 thioredoxin family protein [Motilimonas eburnea]